MTTRCIPLLGLFFTTLSAALSFGCRAGSHLAVEFDGCEKVLAPGLVCVLPTDRQLTLWVPDLKPSETKIEIHAAGVLLTPKTKDPIGQGERDSIVIPPGADRIEVRRTGPGSKHDFWSLSLSETREPKPGERDLLKDLKGKTRFVLKEIQNLRLANARRILNELDQVAPLAALPAKSRFDLVYYRATLAAREEDYRTALAELDRAAGIARRTGLKGKVWFSEHSRAIRFADLGRMHESVELYARLFLERGLATPCEVAQLLNNWAWAILLGREATSEILVQSPEEPVQLLLQTLEILRVNPKCWNFSNLTLDARINLVLAQLQAGHPDLAAGALAEVRSLPEKGTLFQQLWELDLEARIAIAKSQPRQALGIYEEVDRIASEADSPDGRLRAALGGANAAAALGDRDQALRLLSKADRLLDGASLRIPLHEGRETFVSQREGVASLEVQLLLDTGQKMAAFDTARRARTRLLRQLDLSERVASLPAADRKVWNEAIESYQAERQQANEAAGEEWSVPRNEKEAARSAQEDRVSNAERQLDRAFKAFQSPILLNALQPPRPHELVLAFYPLTKEWAVFAADSSGIEVRRFRLTQKLLDQPEALAREILVPFSDRILRAERIRILPYGALRKIDFHKLPFENDVLLSALPVVYGLDLGAAPVTPDSTGTPVPKALLVADPGGNLPGALLEADEVAGALRSLTPPWQVHRLTASAATPEAVRSGLGMAHLFHFSGHGTFGGFGGWDSGLRLANKSQLTVGDLLILNHAPRWAVLSGCETGRAEGAEARIEGFGLANALVIAGSRGVIASVRPVVDRTAPPLFESFYRIWKGQADMAPALRQAQLQWRKEYPNVDWATFRMIEP